MHWFESNMISHVSPIEATEDRIVYLGDYRKLGIGFILGSALMFLACWSPGPSTLNLGEARPWILACSTGLLLTGMVIGYFKVTIIFTSTGVEVGTRSILGRRTRNVESKQCCLHVRDVDVDRAMGCGAVDLVLPDTMIRLEIVARPGLASRQADALRDLSGIEVETDT